MTYDRVTRLHVDLLNAEIAALRDDSPAFALRRYAEHKAELKPYGNPLADRMYEHLAEFERLLTAPTPPPTAARDAMVAAMMYFVKDHDLIPDGDYGCTGLVDDALVVQAAVNIVLGRGND